MLAHSYMWLLHKLLHVEKPHAEVLRLCEVRNQCLDSPSCFISSFFQLHLAGDYNFMRDPELDVTIP